jgi:hypothetical protein
MFSISAKKPDAESGIFLVTAKKRPSRGMARTKPDLNHIDQLTSKTNRNKKACQGKINGKKPEKFNGIAPRCID